MASPKWESHCNSASGVWAGRVAMYAFDDARDPDPTLLAERFRVRAVATRDEDDATTSCVTSSALADADGRIRREEDESDAPAIAILRREREGAVYFEDGTLTAGPAAVRDETGAAVEGTAVFEFTIAAPGGGERAHATLKARVLEVLEEDDAGNSPDADDHRGSSPSDDGLRSRPRRRAYLSLAFERAYVARERWLGPERAVTDAQIADAADAAAGDCASRRRGAPRRLRVRRGVALVQPRRGEPRGDARSLDGRGRRRAQVRVRGRGDRPDGDHPRERRRRQGRGRDAEWEPQRGSIRRR